MFLFRVRPKKWLSMSSFVCWCVDDLNVDAFFIFIYGFIITSIVSVLDSLICFFAKMLPLYGTITNVIGARMQNFTEVFFFYEFSYTNTDGRKDRRWKKRIIPLFLSTISTRSRTSRHLFAVLHLRWLPSVFNRSAGN